MLINHTTGEIAFHVLQMTFDDEGNYLGLKEMQYELKNPIGNVEYIPPKLYATTQ